MSADRIEGLAMDMEDLQRDIDDINNVIASLYLWYKMYACHRTHHQRQNLNHENGNHGVREDKEGGND